MKEQINSLIAKGKTMEAIQLLRNCGIESIADTAILLASRWARNERDEMSGCYSNEHIQMEKRRISSAVLSLKDQLPNYGSKNIITGDSISVGDNFHLGDSYGTVSAPTNVVVNAINSVVVINWLIGKYNLALPNDFKEFLKLKRHGVQAEFNDVIAFGNSILAFMKSKLSEDLFQDDFTKLGRLIKRLATDGGIDNMQKCIAEISLYQADIIDFLQDEVKETLLEKLYKTAKNDETYNFVNSYETFLRKYIETNTVHHLAINQWNTAVGEFNVAIAGKDKERAFFKSKLYDFRTHWLERFSV